MAGKQNPFKHETLTRQLVSLIQAEEFPPGSLLPSQDQLIKRYGVSLTTVRQALATLCDQGLVLPEHGRGVRVLRSTPRVAARHSFGFVVWESNPREASYLLVLEGLSEVMHEHQCGLVFGGFVAGQAGELEKLLDFAARCEGLVISGALDEQMLTAIRRLGKPVVMAGHAVEPSLEEGWARVAWDVEAAGYLGAQMLAMSGRQDLLLLTMGFKTTFHSGMESGFRRGCEEAGLQSPRLWVIDRTHDWVNRLADAAPDGALVIDGALACQLIHHLERLGLAVPRDCSVLGVGSRQRDDLAITTLSRLAWRCHEMGRQCARLLLNPDRGTTLKTLSPQIEMGHTLDSLRPVVQTVSH